MIKKLLITILAIACAAAVWFTLWIRNLPAVENLKKSDTGLFVRVKDAGGKPNDLIVGAKNRSWVPLNQISPHLISAVIASEDDAFFQHEGFDFEEIKNAIAADVKRKRFMRGASTITMQLARNLYLTKEKTLTRKLKEAYITYRLENVLTKKRILELYLNIVEWGPGVYGIGEASEYYFDKRPSELNLNEAALLAVILPNPHYYNPYIRMAQIEKKQNYLLARMRMEHTIEDAEYESAIEEPAILRGDL